jgi:glycosyltransferase involved in cell wall biosynthesis
MSSHTAKVITVIPARNEGKFLPKTLQSLFSQTHPVERIVVVNDGSTDNTELVAKSYERVFVLNLKDRGFDAVGKAILAETLNAGFKKAIELVPDYTHMFIMGADNVLPAKYLEGLLDEFAKESKLVIASGIVVGEFEMQKPSTFHVHGGGRLISREFWIQNNESYPVNVGWESYPVFKANQLGYITKAFQNCEIFLQRETGGRTDFYAYGEAMRAFGYFWMLAIGRSLKLLIRNPSGGLSMFNGYLRGKERYEKPLRNYLNRIQKRRIRKLILRF